MKFYINGWEYGRRYFMSFGWTQREFDKMLDGDVIEKNGNEFYIIIEE